MKAENMELDEAPYNAPLLLSVARSMVPGVAVSSHSIHSSIETFNCRLIFEMTFLRMV